MLIYIYTKPPRTSNQENIYEKEKREKFQVESSRRR